LLVLLLSLTFAATLAGCANIRKDLGAPLAQVAASAWTAPVHYSTVLEAYGPPSKISAIPAGSVFLYEHVDIRERQWGLILPGDLSRFFKFVYATSAANTDVAVFVFDEEGMMMGQATRDFRSDPGGGFSFTLIFKIKSLSDTDEYTRSQEGILDWGMAMIQPLPVGLNAAQSLDSGSRGLDVIRVDGMMGQRALELNQPD
jgi:hypothetical protein